MSHNKLANTIPNVLSPEHPLPAGTKPWEPWQIERSRLMRGQFAKERAAEKAAFNMPAVQQAYTTSPRASAFGTTAPAPKPLSPLVVLSGAELRDKSIPERQVLMSENGSPLFYASSVNQVVAWRGVGKTNFVLGLSGAFCSGGKILDFQADKPRKVLYLDGELPLAQLRDRARLLAGPDWETNLFLLNPEMLAEPRGLDLLAGDGEALKDAVRQTAAEIVILDSQTTLMGGDSLKHDFHEARQNLLRDLRWMGCCVIETHHLGKNGTQRSTSKNDDILDVQMHLKRVEGWEPGDGLLFELGFDKVRHAAHLGYGYQVTLKDGIWSRFEGEQVAQIKALHAEGKSQREIAKQLGISQPTVNRIVRRVGLAALNQKAGQPDSDQTQIA